MQFHILLITFLLCISIDVSLSQRVAWNYGSAGPDVWPDLFPTCGQRSQSPINIRTLCTTYQGFPCFQFSSEYDIKQDFRLINDGSSITAAQINASAFPLTLTGGGLNETFIFRNLHIHWGENYGSGSEHQLNGQKYSAEAHFVHSNAANTRNAVLGIFIQSVPSTNDNSSISGPTVSNWQKYFQAGSNLAGVNDATTIRLKLSALMGTNLERFYRYSGSLTPPPCTENVIWTVFPDPVVLSDNELQGFRTNVHPKNFREPQPLYRRTVYRSFRKAVLSSVPDYACCGNNNRRDY